MMSGANVFLTGAPGAGKTYVLNRYVKVASQQGKRVAVTASTGIAASHLGGTTIHSWSGLGIADRLSADDMRKLSGNDRLRKRYNTTDTLVIDEVSMLHGYRLDMINGVAKLLRENQAPFGGLQVILVGDLFQLPPVNRTGQQYDFIHNSDTWSELNPKICYITEQHRQQQADGLLELLEAMRLGQLEEMHRDLLQGRLGRSASGTVVTRLYAHNLDVESINRRHLNDLTDRVRQYSMLTRGGKYKVEQLIKSVLAPQILELKQDAEVMFVANNFAEGFVNGSRGRVVGFEQDMPLVRLLNGRTIEVKPHSWSINEDGRTVAEVTQLPLRLAWAITIHKSQGMSLDAAEIDLSRAFAPGMGYVALSRVRSLDGLFLQGINNQAMMMHPEIYELDRDLRAASAELAAVTEDWNEATAAKQPFNQLDEDLFDKLKAWRTGRARADGIPPFMVAHNTALAAVAAAMPQTVSELLNLTGFGPKKVDAYGPAIIEIVVKHSASKA